VSSAPVEHAGVASAVNNDVARAAGLIAVAVLPAAAGITGDSYLHPAALASGFHMAALIAAVACALGGLLAFLTIRNPAPTRAPEEAAEYHCTLDAPPLRGARSAVAPAAEG
jgi:hypothetical protein